MFKKITAKNFFSWKSLEFNFQAGITLLSGEEGSGKSSLVNALCWGLYGQLPKNTNIDDVIMDGENSCEVIIELQDGMHIIRSRKPNDLYIQNELSIQRGKDAKETQKLITDVVGMSFSTFCSSVYFAQNYPGNFITASQEDKAKILSELQDLSVFDRATKKSNEGYKQARNDLSVTIMNRQHKETIIRVTRQEYETFDKLSQTYSADKLSELDKIILRNDRLVDEISNIQEEVKEIVNLDSLPEKLKSIEETRGYLSECQQKLFLIDNLKQQKDTALNTLNCPTCGQNLPDNGCTQICVPDNTELLEQEAFLKEELVKIQTEYNDLVYKQNKNNILKEKLNGLIRERSQLGLEIQEIESSQNPYITKIKELINKLNDLEKDLDKTKFKESLLTKRISDLEFLKDGFKDIKSHIFKSLLIELNNRTNSYLRHLFEEASIAFHNISEEGDVSKIQTTVTIDGDDRSLGLLSGGQARRVQLAVDFALSDIVSQRSDRPINLRILDESFKDLSATSMEKLVNVLSRMGGSTILIEHSDLVKNIVDNVYNIELRNGKSYIG